GTVAINIFVGIVIIYGIWRLTEILEMELLSKILGGFLGVGMFALIVVFQQEIRKFLLMLGSTNVNARKRILKRLKLIASENNAPTNV
ncbi:MAG: TIGR00159 family protein, partial [Marinirhabdus sp.]